MVRKYRKIMSNQKWIQPARGTHDLYGETYNKHDFIIKTAHDLATRYGYEPLQTPIFEKTQVFKRSIGEETDIVGKEMYTFKDRGDEEITLRPEGTASVVRALISNNLTQSLPAKFIYSGPMFRYERPQKGRMRQFHQIGVECFGPSSAHLDAQCIDLAFQILKRLGIAHKTTLHINTLGTKESRAKYRLHLVDYLSSHQNQLSSDSQRRLQTNPLRILDSKDTQDQTVLKNAPLLSDFLSIDEKSFFKQVCDYLEILGISYEINNKLVRGLDYYNHTVFEFTTTHLGAQSTVLGGGRYDELVEQMGGPNIPGVGWALGVERIEMLLDQELARPRPIVVIPMTQDCMDQAFRLIQNIRYFPLATELLFDGNFNKKMKMANKLNACAAVIVAPDELQNGKVIVKDLDTGHQNLHSIEDVSIYLNSLYNFKDKITSP